MKPWPLLPHVPAPVDGGDSSFFPFFPLFPGAAPSPSRGRVQGRDILSPLSAGSLAESGIWGFSPPILTAFRMVWVP